MLSAPVKIALIGLLLLLSSAALQGGALSDQYIQQARELNLAATVQWQRILFYQRHGLGQNHGLIDAAHFYLAQSGKDDPFAELMATVQGLFDSSNPAAPDDHVQCLFPARKMFLESMLPHLHDDLPKVKCPRFESWWKERNYESMSLVFSSYYPDNPASMFGHIFLRLHRSKTGQSSDLLDDSINFAAIPDTQNSFFYYWRGAFGGFPGRFSLLPYYMKVQEYNNIESRDLWEYPLVAGQAQIKKILLSLWEFGPHHADYYYFDDNCSYVLLLLMETGDENWDFASNMRVWATPTACLKAVIDKPDLTHGFKFRPSALSRYQERYDNMSMAERTQFAEVLQSDKPEFKGPVASVNTIDAALDYIDFREKLGGTQTAKRYASLRDGFLLQRTQIKQAPKVLHRHPEDRNPSLAVAESWLMLSGAMQSDNHYLRLSWQPVLHDLIGENKGYASDMQIQLMPMSFSYSEQDRTFALDRLDILNIISIQPYNRLMQPKSWMFRLGWDGRVLCMADTNQYCPEAALSYSHGLALPLWDDTAAPLWAGFMSLAAGTEQIVERQTPFLQAGPEMLINGTTPWSQSYAWRNSIARRWNSDGVADWYARSELQTGLRLDQQFQTRFNLRWEQRQANRIAREQSDIQLGILQYF